ncbi:hypothetical protein DPMN_104040 [Dreissena polymorpha]|uniref:HMG domain-containing protein n=1 Tax=Dreissena polymorpha TaxID=45954 RepID=A0A9D4H9L8_DREPO|nr:hypothetical protein DPMN_104040 [Dreissena polymorpha]
MHGRITNPGAPPGSNMRHGNTRRPLPHHFSPIDFKLTLKISYDNTVSRPSMFTLPTPGPRPLWCAFFDIKLPHPCREYARKMAESKSKSRKRAYVYSNPYSLAGTLKYDSFAMPTSSRTGTVPRVGSLGARQMQGTSYATAQTKNGRTAKYTQESPAFSGSITLPVLPSEAEQYYSLIKSTGSYMPVNESLDVFVLLDCDEHTKFIKANSPVIVNRKGSCYTCTCSPDRTQFVDNFETPTPEVDRLHPECVHIFVVKIIVQEYLNRAGLEDCPVLKDACGHDYASNIAYGKELDESHEHIVPFLDNKYVVRVDGSYSVLRTNFGTLKCLTCKNGNSCKHTQFVNKLLNQSVEDMSECVHKIHCEIHIMSNKNNYELKCFSSHKIPFILDNCAINKRSSDLYPINDGIRQVLPRHQKKCMICQNLQFELKPVEHVSTFLSKYECVPVQVYERICVATGCSSVTCYDGQQDCVLNMGRFLIHYEVLRDFMFQYLYSRSTMFSFYNVWLQHQSDNGNTQFARIFSYMYFRQTWFAYLQLMDIDFEADFTCRECGPSPVTMLFDGTCLSFKKNFLCSDEDILLEKQTSKLSGRYSQRASVHPE